MPASLQTFVVELTPPGRGAVAAVLVAGPDARVAVDRHFRASSGRSLASAPADSLLVGRFGLGPGEEVVVRPLADGSVELCCHGGVAAIAMVRGALMAGGCREIAWRDWVRGRAADPIATEARIALADARTERAASVLLDQLHGALEREVRAIVEALEAQAVDSARGRLDGLLARAPLGLRLVAPWRVVLAGRPNVGKSSLLNALLGFTRAIVHHEPGTTRDVVAAATAIDGWPVLLADTAGIHAGSGAIEREGIERAKAELASADLAIVVADASQPWCEVDARLVAASPGAIVVHNKCDLVASPPCDRPPGLRTSAVMGEGIEDLARQMGRRLVPLPPSPGDAVPFTPAQVEALGSARRYAASAPGSAARVLRRLLGL